MRFPRQVLNEVKWREDMEISRCLVSYVHRGAEGDTRTIAGDEIEHLGRSFFRAAGSLIPYHRIRLITYDGRILFEG